jgi:hypothetical protein
MKTLKQVFGLLLLTVLMTSFSQCSSAQKLQTKAPIAFGDVYCKKWVSGVAQGPSGLDIYIPVKGNAVQLDSVYFRGKGAKLEINESNNLLYIGKFASTSKEKTDLIMSSNSKQEYGNKPPTLPVEIPFELAPNECVVSYKVNGKTKYYKLENVVEKRDMDVPMTAPTKNN